MNGHHYVCAPERAEEVEAVFLRPPGTAFEVRREHVDEALNTD